MLLMHVKENVITNLGYRYRVKVGVRKGTCRYFNKKMIKNCPFNYYYYVFNGISRYFNKF